MRIRFNLGVRNKQVSNGSLGGQGSKAPPFASKASDFAKASTGQDEGKQGSGFPTATDRDELG